MAMKNDLESGSQQSQQQQSLQVSVFGTLLAVAQDRRYFYVVFVALFTSVLLLASTYLHFLVTYTQLRDVQAMMVTASVLVGLSGWIPALLWISGLPVLSHLGSVSAVSVDALVWLATTTLLAVCTSDMGTIGHESKTLAMTVLLASLRLNTFYVSTKSLVAISDRCDNASVNGSKRGSGRFSLSSAEGVPMSLVEDVIASASALTRSQRRTLLYELDRACGDGHLDFGAYVQFYHNVGLRLELWKLQGGKAARPHFEELRANLDFGRLLHKHNGALSQSSTANAEEVAPYSLSKAIYVSSALMWTKPLEVLTLVGLVVMYATAQPLLSYVAGLLVSDATSGLAPVYSSGTLMGVMAALFAGSALLYVLITYLTARLVSKVFVQVQHRLADKVCRGNTAFDAKFRPGKLGATFASSLARLEIVLKYVFDGMLAPALQLFIGLAFISSVDVSYMIFSFGLVPFVVSFKVFSVESTKHSTTLSGAIGDVQGVFQNLVELRGAIRTCAAADFAVGDRWTPYSDAVQTAWHSMYFWSLLLQATFLFAGLGLYTLTQIVFLLSLQQGNINAGDFVAVTGYVNTTVLPIQTLGQVARRVTSAAGAIRDIDLLLNTPNVEKEPAADAASRAPLAPLSESITFDNVSFAYGSDGDGDGESSKAPGTVLALDGVSATIAAGSYVCLCGGSGSGKSTLLAVLMRFRECSSGRVLFDGTDIASTNLASFRDQSAVVFQDTLILDGTIADNILFGTSDGVGPEQEVETLRVAARDAEILDVIEQLPAGFDTVVGKGSSVTLSGGQLQRICLARALCRKPKLLLLDEATSALDPVTESSIIATLERLRIARKDLTVVSVTHHPSTAVNADQIIVLDKGKVAEIGTHSELIAKQGGIFSTLAASQ